MKMTKNKLGYAAMTAGIAALALSSCASSKARNGRAGEMVSNDIDNGYLIMSDDNRTAIEHTNAFALNLLRTQTGMDSKVVSPISVAYLMAMLANGADGQTRTEIMKTLNMDESSLQNINETYRSIISTASQLDRQTKINIANCIAVNRQIELKPDYSTAMRTFYDAYIESMDFTSQKALNKINSWCSKQTEGMIPKIVDQLDAGALAVLMNAVYFNGSWTNKFDKADTKTENFRGYTRDIKKVPMMHQEDKFMYTANDDFSAVCLPYGNGTYTMTVILPAENKSTEDLTNTLDTKTLNEMRDKMDECIVDLKLPRFTTSTETQLNKPISELGAPAMFTSGIANFSNMTDASMYVSAMIQRAKIEVSESGTKAAAVTAAIMTMSALRPDEPRHVTFHANRPFVYMITERNTGAIVFIGQYTGNEV